MARKKMKILERRFKTFLNDVHYFPLDLLDVVKGSRPELTPPRRLIFVGDGNFGQVGAEFFKYFVDFGGLKPHHRILDVGCGIGRMAIPLTTFLKDGSYDGFDIVPRGIKWCNKNISPRFPNFRFQLADVYNEWYHPSGSCEASQYRFPFDDSSFDFIFLTSVFTHMLPAELENYFSEIGRVLRNKGRVLMTFFLLNGESRTLISQGKSSLDFKYAGEGFSTISPQKPESAVAYDEQYVKGLFERQGMKIVGPVRYGSWCNRRAYTSYQDIIVAGKD